MYNRFTLFKKYIRYWLKAANGRGHGIHSPFVYRFVRDVLNDKRQYGWYDAVSGMRKKLLSDETLLHVKDFGAGSALNLATDRSVKSIAASAAKPPKYARLIGRMVAYFKPVTLMEMGTSLGITTAAMALAAPGTRIITMEGADAVAAKAKENFHALGIENISLVNGNFDDTLQQVLQENPGFGFVFIDGNHREEPTKEYFLALLARAGNDSILVFDDIHWSRGMENAWAFIQQHERVTCTIDLFFIGIVFLRPAFKQKEHFIIRF